MTNHSRYTLLTSLRVVDLSPGNCHHHDDWCSARRQVYDHMQGEPSMTFHWRPSDGDCIQRTGVSIIKWIPNRNVPCFPPEIKPSHQCCACFVPKAWSKLFSDRMSIRGRRKRWCDYSLILVYGEKRAILGQVVDLRSKLAALGDARLVKVMAGRSSTSITQAHVSYLHTHITLPSA